MTPSEGLGEKFSSGASSVPIDNLLANAEDVRGFEEALRLGGISGALRFLGARTSHRFTGVFRFDGEVLRSLALVDKWLPEVDRGHDIPLAQAYCAHLKATNQPLEVTDGRTDPRTPSMAKSAVASYCGAVIHDEKGEAWGALCHFDPNPCESKISALPLLVACAVLIHESSFGG